MSFKLNFLKDRVVATFENDVLENEIKNAFIELVDSVSIKKIKFLIFDFSGIESYHIPKDYMETLKMITLFSSTWNTEIKVAIIATNPNIKTVVNGILEKQEDFAWKFNLFKEIQSGIDWCEENKLLK